MALDSALLEILRCPDEHHAVLDYDEVAQVLTCVQCHRIFAIHDGVPVLLLDESRLPDAAPGPVSQVETDQVEAGQEKDEAGQEKDEAGQEKDEAGQEKDEEAEVPDGVVAEVAVDSEDSK